MSCESCAYAANMEKATSKLASIEDLKPEGDGKPLLVHTPGKGAIADVAEFLKISAKQDIKTVAYMAQNPAKDKDGARTLEQPVVVFLRGDHPVNRRPYSDAGKGESASSHANRRAGEILPRSGWVHQTIRLVVKSKDTLGIQNRKKH